MCGRCGPGLAASIIFFELLILFVIYLTVPQSFGMAWDLITYVWSEIWGQIASLTRYLFISTEPAPTSMASIVTDKIQSMIAQPESHGWIYREVWNPVSTFWTENFDEIEIVVNNIHAFFGPT